jgi:hypothetical protein
MMGFKKSGFPLQILQHSNLKLHNSTNIHSFQEMSGN